MNNPKQKHGNSYNSWRGMLERCRNPNHIYYRSYGGRGIKVCERWKLYGNFYEDMGERIAGMVLDRIDNDGDYEPSNCRWVTRRASEQNKRNNRHVICFGEKMVVAEANRRLGMSQNYLRSTMETFGWPEIDVGILPAVRPCMFLRRWLRGSCRIEFI